VRGAHGERDEDERRAAELNGGAPTRFAFSNARSRRQGQAHLW
jgi:hypothetical protein